MLLEALSTTETTIPALERARNFVESNDISFLLHPAYFQAEIMVVQSLIITALIYISVKVSKL
jgi:hypothetical protein